MIERRLAPTERPGPPTARLLFGSASAETERARRALREAVVPPRVCRGLNLRVVLSLRLVEVIQPARSAGGVRVIQSPCLVGVVDSARRAFHLTSKCRARSNTHKQGNRHRHDD